MGIMRFSIGLFLVLSLASLQARTPEDHPNFIVIYTDDHGWPDLGVQGIHSDLKTPHLDRLALGGVRALSGYSTAPQCVPSRAGLLAGRSQNRFGVESNGSDLAGFNAQQTLAERLREVGYATGQIGKWHLGPLPEIPQHGFQDVFAKNANRPGWANYDLEGRTTEGGLESSKLYHIDACSAAARAFILRHRESPFFLYLAYRAPHVPLDAPAHHLARFPGPMPERRRQALAMLAAVDDGVGLIRKTLEESGLLRHTLLFVVGDNGAPLKIHKLDEPGGGPGWDGSLNEPMNGEKGMLTEGGIRVPFLTSWEGRFQPGLVYPHPITTLDIAATATALAGLKPDPQLDGVNLDPYLSGERKEAPHEYLHWRWISQAAVRAGDWKLLRGGDREYLFHLGDDPGETQNLLSRHPEVAQRLRQSLQQWTSELDPPGLATGPMAETWNEYFDHYLDGKPSRPPGKRTNEESLKGWVARNATMSQDEQGLKVVASPDAKSRQVFLAFQGVSLQGSVHMKIRIQSTEPGKVGVAWRQDGEKDFASGQSASLNHPGSPDWVEHVLEFQPTGKAIHLRLFLPGGTTRVSHLEFQSQKGGKGPQWDFTKSL